MKSLTLALLAAVSLSGQDPQEIVRHSTERDWTDFESRKDYLYQQRREFANIPRMALSAPAAVRPRKS